MNRRLRSRRLRSRRLRLPVLRLSTIQELRDLNAPNWLGALWDTRCDILADPDPDSRLRKYRNGGFGDWEDPPDDSLCAGMAEMIIERAFRMTVLAMELQRCNATEFAVWAFDHLVAWRIRCNRND